MKSISVWCWPLAFVNASSVPPFEQLAADQHLADLVGAEAYLLSYSRRMQVHSYQTADGRVPVKDWLDGLRDGTARIRIVAAIDKLQSGARGDWRTVGGGVWEMRLHFGPGYRVYCGQRGTEFILLLCGGDKGSQARDIETAHDYWKDFKARNR